MKICLLLLVAVGNNVAIIWSKTVWIYSSCSNAALKDHAKRMYIGTFSSSPQWSDEQMKVVLAREFNQFTPGNDLKWDAVEPVRGQRKYANGDMVVSFALQHGMKIRGHTLVWHSQIPNWLNSLGTAELKTVLESHIKDEVTHYKGKMYAWDVVNEIFEWNGQLRNNSIWNKHFNDSYVADAFRWAHAADPNAKLYINDYGVEDINSKSTALYNFVKKLKSQGVPIHGVGFQNHISLGEWPKTLQQNLERFAALGVEVAVTELDDKIKLPATQANLNQQGIDYGEVTKACAAVSKCVGVTVSGFTDKHSWIPNVSPGWGAACLFDEHYNPKPAVDGVAKYLQ